MKITSSTDYTMDFDNKMDIMKLLDYAEPILREICEDYSTAINYYEVDDVSWGTNRFSIPIFDREYPSLAKNRMPRERLLNTFTFVYHPDDVLERSAMEQLQDALDEFIEELKMQIDPEVQAEYSYLYDDEDIWS